MKPVHQRTAVFKIGYDIVFCTQYQKKIFADEIKESLKEILAGIAT
jgi:REP element-mobilizing transposase RayT